MTNALCEKITQKVKANSDRTYEEAEIIYYGLQILLFEIISSTAILGISILLGILPYVIVISIVFGMLRVAGGGAHGRSRLECFAGYIIFIFASVYLSKQIEINYYVMSLLFMLSLAVFAVYAPGDSFEKPIRDVKKRKKLKAVSIALLGAFYIAAFLIKNNDPVVSNLIILASSYAAFLLSPLGYRFTRCRHGFLICDEGGAYSGQNV